MRVSMTREKEMKGSTGDEDRDLRLELSQALEREAHLERVLEKAQQHLLERNQLLEKQRTSYYEELDILREQLYQKERGGKKYVPMAWGRIFDPEKHRRSHMNMESRLEDDFKMVTYGEVNAVVRQKMAGEKKRYQQLYLGEKKRLCREFESERRKLEEKHGEFSKETRAIYDFTYDRLKACEMEESFSDCGEEGTYSFKEFRREGEKGFESKDTTSRDKDEVDWEKNSRKVQEDIKRLQAIHQSEVTILFQELRQLKENEREKEKEIMEEKKRREKFMSEIENADENMSESRATARVALKDNYELERELLRMEADLGVVQFSVAEKEEKLEQVSMYYEDVVYHLKSTWEKMESSIKESLQRECAFLEEKNSKSVDMRDATVDTDDLVCEENPTGLMSRLKEDHLISNGESSLSERVGVNQSRNEQVRVMSAAVKERNEIAASYSERNEDNVAKNAMGVSLRENDVTSHKKNGVIRKALKSEGDNTKDHQDTLPALVSDHGSRDITEKKIEDEIEISNDDIYGDSCAPDTYETPEKKSLVMPSVCDEEVNEKKRRAPAEESVASENDDEAIIMRILDLERQFDAIPDWPKIEQKHYLCSFYRLRKWKSASFVCSETVEYNPSKFADGLERSALQQRDLQKGYSTPFLSYGCDFLHECDKDMENYVESEIPKAVKLWVRLYLKLIQHTIGKHEKAQECYQGPGPKYDDEKDNNAMMKSLNSLLEHYENNLSDSPELDMAKILDAAESSNKASSLPREKVEMMPVYERIDVRSKQLTDEARIRRLRMAIEKKAKTQKVLAATGKLDKRYIQTDINLKTGRPWSAPRPAHRQALDRNFFNEYGYAGADQSRNMNSNTQSYKVGKDAPGSPKQRMKRPLTAPGVRRRRVDEMERATRCTWADVLQPSTKGDNLDSNSVNVCYRLQSKQDVQSKGRVNDELIGELYSHVPAEVPKQTLSGYLPSNIYDGDPAVGTTLSLWLFDMFRRARTQQQVYF